MTPQRLDDFKDIHVGVRCFIIGNAPSLKGMPLRKLENELIFTVNRGYLAAGLGLPPSAYYVVADPMFYRQYYLECRAAKVGTRFYRQNVFDLPEYQNATDREEAYAYPYVESPQMDEPGGRFSTDFVAKGTYRGGTVLLEAVQIANLWDSLRSIFWDAVSIMIRRTLIFIRHPP